MSLVSDLGNRFKAAFTGEVIKVGSGAVLVYLLARLLGPEAYGLLFLAISVLQTASLVSQFGFARSASRYVADFKETAPGQVPHVIWTGIFFNAIAVAVVSAVFLFGHGWIAHSIGEPELAPLLLVGTAFLACSSAFTFVRWVLQGFEDISGASTLTAVNHLLRVTLALGLVFIGMEATGALVGYIVAYGVSGALGIGYLLLKIHRNYTPEPVQENLRKKIAKYSVSIAVTQSSHTLDHRVDRVLIGFFAGPLAVGYYTLGKQLVQFIETPMTALGFTLSPTFGSQKAQGNQETAARIYESAFSKALLLYLPAAAGVVLLARPGIEYVFGDEYIGAVTVLQILSAFAVMRSLTKMTTHALDYLGRAKERAYIKATTAVMNVLLNVLLIPLYGVEGAAVATVVTYGVYTLTCVYYMHDELDLRVVWLARQATYALGVTLLMSVVVAFLSRYISGLPSLIVVVLAGVGVWLAFVLSFDLVDVNQLKKAIS